jgi:hypothetical protein
LSFKFSNSIAINGFFAPLHLADKIKLDLQLKKFKLHALIVRQANLITQEVRAKSHSRWDFKIKIALALSMFSQAKFTGASQFNYLIV